jgi:hypothetical protein
MLCSILLTQDTLLRHMVRTRYIYIQIELYGVELADVHFSLLLIERSTCQYHIVLHFIDVLILSILR